MSLTTLVHNNKIDNICICNTCIITFVLDPHFKNNPSTFEWQLRDIVFTFVRTFEGDGHDQCVLPTILSRSCFINCFSYNNILLETVTSYCYPQVRVDRTLWCPPPPFFFFFLTSIFFHINNILQLSMYHCMTYIQ